MKKNEIITDDSKKPKSLSRIDGEKIAKGIFKPKKLKNNINTRFKKRPDYDLNEIEAIDELDFFLKFQDKQQNLLNAFNKINSSWDEVYKLGFERGQLSMIQYYKEFGTLPSEK